MLVGRVLDIGQELGVTHIGMVSRLIAIGIYRDAQGAGAGDVNAHKLCGSAGLHQAAFVARLHLVVHVDSEDHRRARRIITLIELFLVRSVTDAHVSLKPLIALACNVKDYRRIGAAAGMESHTFLKEQLAHAIGGGKCHLIILAGFVTIDCAIVKGIAYNVTV